MSGESRLAELKLAEAGITLYGGVLKMSRGGAAVRLQTLPAEANVLAKGTSAELVVMARGNCFAAHAHILHTQQSDVVLGFDAPVTTVQRRNRARRACFLSVALRAIHGSGCFGAWHTAEIEDIGAGGMRIVIPGSIEVPSAMEVHFKVDDPADTARSIADVSVDSTIHVETPPIRAAVRLVHGRPQPDGSIVAGVAFTRITPSDAMRVARFCNDGPQV